MEQKAAQAKFDALHQDLPWHDGTMTDWAKERSASHPYHYTHGTSVWVSESNLGLGGNFLSGKRDEPEDGHGDG